MTRFEAVFYEGEVNERLPEWNVVEWTVVNMDTGAKMGRKVWKTYDMENGEREAREIAAVMQEEYNRAFAEL